MVSAARRHASHGACLPVALCKWQSSLRSTPPTRAPCLRTSSCSLLASLSPPLLVGPCRRRQGGP
eukprot:7379268-Prymnesium_polylepis.1